MNCYRNRWGRKGEGIGKSRCGRRSFGRATPFLWNRQGAGCWKVIGFSTRAPFQVSRRKADILSLKVKNFLSLKVAAFLGRQSSVSGEQEFTDAGASVVRLRSSVTRVVRGQGARKHQSPVSGENTSYLLRYCFHGFTEARASVSTPFRSVMLSTHSGKT